MEDILKNKRYSLTFKKVPQCCLTVVELERIHVGKIPH